MGFSWGVFLEFLKILYLEKTPCLPSESQYGTASLSWGQNILPLRGCIILTYGDLGGDGILDVEELDFLFCMYGRMNQVGTAPPAPKKWCPTRWDKPPPFIGLYMHPKELCKSPQIMGALDPLNQLRNDGAPNKKPGSIVDDSLLGKGAIPRGDGGENSSQGPRGVGLQNIFDNQELGQVDHCFFHKCRGDDDDDNDFDKLLGWGSIKNSDKS